MRLMNEEITKDRYEELSKLSKHDLYNAVSDNIPVSWACGYGWYGCRLIERDDKYYIEHTLGSTCD